MPLRPAIMTIDPAPELHDGQLTVLENDTKFMGWWNELLISCVYIKLYKTYIQDGAPQL